ncbi:carbamoyltransferase C-terminal domain-containing protein [Streptomyces barringtoniae]|uniref:carbamoyltransferase C-terminal domain-containing protein n=1 Tax=Streptomyces barringtoniae TaxID=2892029 RepID=UPI001E35CABA|nr:carbamoyltransferase C-terminal domain-containing protein [Streptomyces barringtoniae]MCC5478884.1 S8 family serine peptidase [Streptomyces barringtoniae]
MTGIGAGVRVLVMSDGSVPAEEGSPTDGHTERVARLCARLAPGAEIGYACAADLKARTLAADLRRIVTGWDVVAMPWSSPEPDAERLGVRRAFEEVARDPAMPLFVAAAGHDGPGRLRFPASCTSVLAVGVTGADGAPTAYCGTDLVGRKPQVLVADGAYPTESASGGFEPMRGTSAAVGVVAGWAAVVLGRLRGGGKAVPSALLRAALLASAGPGGVLEGGPEDLDAPAAQGADVQVFALDGGELRLRVGGGPARVAVVATGAAETVLGGDRPLWLPPAAEMSVTVPGTERATGAGWLVADAEEGTVTVECSGPAYAAVGGRAVAEETGRAPHAAPAARRGPVVLGLSASHDASACLLSDGVPRVGVQQERVTRRKHDGVGYLNSRAAADYCLNSAGVGAAEVDAFAFNAQPLLPGYVGLSVPSAARDFDLFDPFDERVVYVSHHLAHAFSAFWTSRFEEAVVVVCDGSGGSVLGADDLLISGPELKEYLERPLEGRLPRIHVFSVYHFDRGGYRLLFRELADSFNVRVGSSSIGETYAAVSQYVFGDWQEGSGKLMGLAPWGRPGNAGPSLLEDGPDGLPRFRADWKDLYRRPSDGSDPLDHADLAARVQADLEEALLARVRYAMTLVPGCRNLAYAGGVALNSVANDRIARESGADRFFVVPAASDAGVSLGAAAAAHFRLTGSTRRDIGDFDDYLGHPYTQEDHDSALALVGDRVAAEPLSLPGLADRIAAGEVIGWFRGGSEFGPRALGHRSVFADARSRDTWDFINAQIKFREDFRPLAPIVPEEVAAKYFELDAPSPHMLRVVKVREEYRAELAAVTHVDGTARVQTVSEAANPEVHRLLHLVGERTGFPVMVNTSLNRRGEPMIETPGQALDMLLATHLSGMVLGDRFVRRLAGLGTTLDLDSCIALAPGARLRWEQDGSATRLRITGGAEGKAGLRLPEWAFTALSRAGSGRPLSAYLPGCLTGTGTEVDAALAFLTALHARCLVVVTRRRAVADRTTAPTGDSTPEPHPPVRPRQGGMS